MKQEDIKRMNELYHLSQEKALSEDEFAEWEELKKRYVRRFLKANCSQAIWSSGVRDMLVSISAAETLCMHRQRGITSKLRQ